MKQVKYWVVGLALVIGVVVMLVSVWQIPISPEPEPPGKSVSDLPAKAPRFKNFDMAPGATDSGPDQPKPVPIGREGGGTVPKGPAAEVPAEPAAASPAAVPAPADDIRALLSRFKDTSVPLETRQAEILKLAKKGDEQALRVLTALGDERVYLNWAAVEALGAFGGSPEKPAVERYLKGKLDSDDSQIACAAIRGYATLMGTAAVPELSAMLGRNHERPDGHQEIVCSAIVKALQETGSTEATPALIGELGRSEEKGWSLEYGSRLVEALRFLKTPDGGKAMIAYADRLEARKPSDPLAKQYFEDKIAEARRAAGRG